jgi:excisionase family DNA binding protein
MTTKTKDSELELQPLYWTQAQVCQITGLSMSTVSRAIRKGDLVPLRVGFNTRFTKETLAAWIEKKNAQVSSVEAP